MISRIEKEKRIDLALEVFKEVSNKFTNAELLIAGDGNLKEKFKKLNIRNVSFLGWKDDATNLFLESDIYLMTSEFEGYGMTLIEAGASGCPIVTTKVGVAKTDLFIDGVNSYVCPVGDVDCLSKKLLDLVENKDKRDLFSQNMKESIKKNVYINKEEYVQKYVGLLENLYKK